MAKILAMVTDETVRFDIHDAISNLEEERMIEIPEDARAEFEDECVQTVIDAYELHELDLFRYNPDYEETVLDIATSYGYLKED